MKRVKRHKIKHEKPETSTAFTRKTEEHDLAYYIHDRVELMHQVFSVLKPKDLKVMAPECVRRLSIDDLQELCTEELLGISSKRLLAILDGAEPPSDTESSSQSSDIVAISLDSISSDEELLSQNTKKKHKHRRRDSKDKRRKSKKSEEPQEDPELSKASRAGLTVLELLELQARARAIRAQLQQEQAKKSAAEPTAVDSSQHSSDSEIEIKEEPAEVVILSSDEEKPNVKELEKATASSNATSKDTEKSNESSVANNRETSTTGPEKSKSKKNKDKSKKKSKEKKKRNDSASGKESEKNYEVREKVAEETIAIEDKSTKDSPDIINIDANNKKDDSGESQKITKRVNDLIITVPQQTSRKIKLKRNKMTVLIPKVSQKEDSVVEKVGIRPTSVVTIPETENSTIKLCSAVSKPTKEKHLKTTAQAQNNGTKNKGSEAEKQIKDKKNKDKYKKKNKKKEKRQSIDEDHDEITLQLSDSEKMDLLEDFDRKKYDQISSSDSESSSSDSEDSSQITNDTLKDSTLVSKDEEPNKSVEVDIRSKDSSHNKDEIKEIDSSDKPANEQNEIVKIKDDDSSKLSTNDSDNIQPNIINKNNEIGNADAMLVFSPIFDKGNSNNDEKAVTESQSDSLNEEDSPKNVDKNTGYISTGNNQYKVLVISSIGDIPVQNYSDKESQNDSVLKQSQDTSSKSLQTNENVEKADENSIVTEDVSTPEIDKDKTSFMASNIASIEEAEKNSKDNPNDKELSEGEISDPESSEVEALEVTAEVVCISDEETPKKKKKKDKKSKKQKKQSDFRENADQNFYKDSETLEKVTLKDINEHEIVDLEDDDILEFMELSNDSSCYEVEGTTLSKEPTVEEIAALSAKIDEIEREDIITEQEIQQHETILKEINDSKEHSATEDLENISWKDRYLDSKKVKKVLSTSNIFNALRKKNKELKMKIEESKKIEQKAEIPPAVEEKEIHPEKDLEEGSIEQYNTLLGSTKFVDPVPDPVEIAKQKEEELKEQERKAAEVIAEQEKEVAKAVEMQVTGEMKKDAKQLLKIYKKLLKYNDVKKQKDPNKKKSKKKKKKDINTANVTQHT